MMYSDPTIDRMHMQTALDLAWQGRFSTSPNPRVGCVLAHGRQVVGQGFHLRAGGPHAEIHALRQAGDFARGATAYVTLEPCAHHGRTGPCAQALIDAGVTRVVAALQDPHPQVAGRGLAMLQAAGIVTECGLMADVAREQNRGFLSRIERGRPFVRLKTAASLDGKTALADGRSQWITGAAARADVQLLRAESCALLTGIGTVLADDPQLNVRAFPTLRQPLRVVLDSRLRIPLHSRLLQDGGPTLIVTGQADDGRFDHLPHVRLWTGYAAADGCIDLSRLLADLAQREQVGELMVEAGASLSAALLQQQQVDEIVHYQAPKILGQPGRGLFALPEQPAALAAAPGWHSHSVTLLADDLKWVLRRTA